MIFKVSESFEGSYVLNTLNRVINAGMTVSIHGDDLYASDVRMAVGNGILIPQEEYDESELGKGQYVMVLNKSKTILIVDGASIAPGRSELVDRSLLSSPSIQAAQKSGAIEITYHDAESDAVKKGSRIKVGKKATEKKTPKKKVTKKATKKKTKKKKVKKAKEKVKAEKEEKEKRTMEPSKTGEDIEVTPVVWDGRAQELKEAQKVPDTPDILRIDEDKEKPVVDFIDTTEEPNDDEAKGELVYVKVNNEKSVKKTKKAKKKKAASKTIKKKEKAKKKTKVKTIEPVGDIKPPKTEMDAAIELDSRGKPIENASDTLQHLIDSLFEPEDVSFVDEEQAHKRLDNRQNTD